MNLLIVDLNLLKVLHALIEERNVTRAGERIGRSQPAMSNALNRLRSLFDDPLLVRGAGGLQLTPRAEALREPLAQVLGSIEDCLTNAGDFVPETATNLFRISAPDYISLPVMPRLTARLSKLAPNMDIHLVTEDRDIALDGLDKNRVDIALGNFTQTGNAIQSQPLFEERFVCLVRKGHPLLQGKVTTDDILSYPHLLVSASGARTGIFDAILSDMGKQRRIAISVSHFLLAPYLLEESDMVGVFTRGVSQTLRRSFNLIEREIPFAAAAFTATMAWHLRGGKDPAQHWLRKQIEEICTNYGAEDGTP